ncbi:MAG: hypothetical protein AAFR51_11120 [Pseudomonadota bacterium]
MDGSFKTDSSANLSDLSAAAHRILQIQTPDGAIAWFENGPWDPWNHVESAMALSVMGHGEAAVAAYDYLVATQRPDGAWLGEYGNALPMVDRDFISREKAPAVLDTNFCAYPAVGIAHFAALTGDLDRARKWWPMVKRGLDFVLSLQRADGTIPWAMEAIGTKDEDALRAGNASIAKSLECGLYLAQRLDQDAALWQTAHARLLTALRTQPDAFDRRGTGGRFAMDWYYPVLSGALTGETAQQHLGARWTDFVIPGAGCRCVLDEPWVTVAETAELVLALLTCGDTERATELFDTLAQHRDQGCVYWMGRQMKEQIFWPREQPSWTQGAVILAADALRGVSPASQVLTTSLI